ncbi:C10 family peptidase [Sphingobacterium sp. BIGb0165]|uniref:C10 family peptidase n=1 Tax=Sphingobacterium sp. BIGb0165 TaxID=2940615 RepID=UPI002169DEC0|nr:C10 family peptidase [Sphingobacterium sp. BIGb0165]MCS4229285.1 hypothetical protein [Sphingobacterium sp. BIGb0165]
MRKIYTVVVLALLALGCSKESEDLQQKDRETSAQLSLSEEEIRVLSIESESSKMRNIDDIYKEVENASTILSRNNSPFAFKLNARRVERIRMLTDAGSITRKSARTSKKTATFNDTLAYVVNFANEDGFLLIAADKRVKVPLLAIVESGNLGDTTYNGGLGAFLGMAEMGIKQSILDYEKLKDSVTVEFKKKGLLLPKSGANSIATDVKKKGIRLPKASSTAGFSGGDEDYDYEGEIYYETTLVYKERVVEKKGPLLATKWSQSTPFNDNVRYKKCGSGTSPAGCVPVAVGQLMAFWKYPAMLYTDSYNWSQINLYPRELDMVNLAPANVKSQVANLMDNLGKKMDSSYACDATGTNSDKVPGLLSASGFLHGGMQDYNYNTVVTSINNGQPLFAGGYSSQVKVLGVVVGYEGGHAWIIDGYLTTETKYNYIAERRSRTDGAIIDRWTGSDISRYDYHHVNWGWGGSRDGFYSAYYFDAVNYPDFSSNVPLYGGLEGQPYNYEYKLEILPFIRK